MNKLFIVFLTSISFFFIACNQDVKVEDSKFFQPYDGLKGNVESYTDSAFFIEKDRSEMLLLENFFSSERKEPKLDTAKAASIVSKFFFDDKGQCTEYESTYIDAKHGRSTRMYDVIWAAKGIRKEYKQMIITHDKTTVSHFKLIKATSNTTLYTESYKLDNKTVVDSTYYKREGNTSTTTHINHDGGEIVSINTFDDNNNLIENKTIIDGKTSIDRYQYNDSNFEIKKSSWTLLGGDSSLSYLYIYTKIDSLGNWIEKTDMQIGSISGDIPIQITKRKIVYR